VPISSPFSRTANAMQGDRERCLEAGMDDYISKLVKFEALAVMLRKCLLPPGSLSQRERAGGEGLLRVS
jgi:CheY-like chemotaxis protein